MNITVTKLTDIDLAHRACEFTMHKGGRSTINLRRLYGSEHSPARTQMFWVEMKGIASSVSVHFVRHKIGVEHYVSTNRPDRGADFVADRDSPVNHAMLCNAQTLIAMARERLCTNAEEPTRQVFTYLKDAIRKIDPDLAEFMVVKCQYRGQCYEPKCCGMSESYYENVR